MKTLVSLSVLALVFAYAYANTPCLSHQRNSRPSGHGFSMNITCDSEGKYHQMQCTPNTISPKWCACFMPERQASNMSTKVSRCECHMRKGAMEDAGKSGCELPQCAPNGSFKLIQTVCGGKRHCVDPVTGVKTSELVNGESCPNSPSNNSPPNNSSPNNSS